MLKITPIETKEEQERICSLCDIDYDISTMAYVAYVDDALVGAAQFSIHGKCAYIHDIKNANGVDDIEALFIMGRGLLNYVDLIGVHDAYLKYPERIDKKLIAWIGFHEIKENNESNGNNENKYYMNLRGFFDGKHEHKQA